ncbi:MAG: hypothetical protein AB2A00_16265 [Myxococcota bacterium]
MNRGALVGLGLMAVVLGCTPQRLFPDKVGMGVARLTVRNVGNLVSLIEADTRCGFSSEAVRAEREEEGQLGGQGVATWRVNGCELDFPSLTTVSTDCNGVETLVMGKATVTAVKTLRGTLSGNPANPVIPGSPDAIRFEVTATFDKFTVRVTDADNSLTIQDGTVSFVVEPHLAVNAELGVCSIPTGDVSISDVVYDKAHVEVVADGQRFTVDVPFSDYDAQAGKWGERENFIEGTITVWDREVAVPTADDKAGLDPEYDPAKMATALECAEGLKLPVSYECEPLTDQIAEGTARLTVCNFGNLVAIVDADTTCGFSSAAVAGNPQVTGELGAAGGQAVFTISEPCTITLNQPVLVSEDCNGVKTYAQGSITVTGTKTVRGIVSGDPTAPIVPTRRDPAEINVQATFSNFKVTKTDSPHALTIVRGGLSGVMRPRLAKDTTTGACSVATETVEFSELSYDNAEVLLSSEGNNFRARVDGSALNAQSGTKDNVTNHLDGSITVDGERFVVPLDGSGVLDPEFDAVIFENAGSCKPNVVVPPSDAECLLTDKLGEGAARLSVANFGALVQTVEANTSCGFSSEAVKNGVSLTGTVGERGGEALYTISSPCTVTFSAKTEVSRDCNGVVTWVEGTATVTGTKRLRGIRTGDLEQPIVPTTRDPAEISLTATLTDFRVTMSNSNNALTIKAGTLSGKLRPRLALDEETGACSIATPNVEFQDITYSNARLLLSSEGKSFLLDVASASLDAQNGEKDGRQNFLAGTMDVDGKHLLVPLDQSKPVLNPQFDPMAFTTSYACTPHIAIPQSDAECSFHKTLGEGASRLLIQTVGTLASMINTDTDCGFENTFVKLGPDQVEGDDGELGSMHWSIQDCELGQGGQEVYQHDCNGGDLWVSGTASVDASRTVRGIREKMLWLIDSIRPNTRESVDIFLDHVDLTEFTAGYNEPDTGEPKGTLTIHSGTLSALIQPVLAERRSDAGKFDVAPYVVVSISEISNVVVRNVNATLHTEGKTFHVRIDEANLSAFNGSYQGDTNWLTGNIKIDGQTVEFTDIPLNPSFNQQSFNSGYACMDDLMSVIPVNG